MPHLLISGGSRGIGRACVELFARKGYKVSSLSRTGRNEDAVDDVSYFVCDVKEPESVSKAVNDAISENGNIDVLISNAGIARSGLAQDMGFGDYRDIMDTNFGGLFNLTSEVIPHMVRQGKGVILAVSSMWGQPGASWEGPLLPLSALQDGQQL